MRTGILTAWLTGLLVGAAVHGVRAEDAVRREMAASCPKCECIWVSRPDQRGEIAVYRTGVKDECKDCVSAAAHYFKTGTIGRACKTCGHLAVCNVTQIDRAPLPPWPVASPPSVMAPQCHTVWEKKSGDPGRFTVYSPEKREGESCCQDVAINMIEYGKATGSCRRCSKMLNACSPSEISTALAFTP